MTRLISTEEALAALGISRAELRSAMLVTPATIAQPWIAYGGTGRRVRYRWQSDAVISWWREVCAWRRSKSAETASESDGATPTARPVAASAPAPASRVSSSARSKKRERAGSGGRLPRLRDILSSGT